MGEAAQGEAEPRKENRHTGPVLPLGYFRPPAAEDPPNELLPLSLVWSDDDLPRDGVIRRLIYAIVGAVGLLTFLTLLMLAWSWLTT